MTHPSKRKGNNYERELVNFALESGLRSKRAYASNGKSLGLHAEVDLIVEDFLIQAKRRKIGMSAAFTPSEHVDAVVCRGDAGESLVVMRWSDWLDMVAAVKEPVFLDRER